MCGKCNVCKCKNDEVNYDDPKWEGLIPSTTSPHNLLNKESSEESTNIFLEFGHLTYMTDLG